MRRLLLNGKFLSAAPTGVHRVAGELARALQALIVDGHPAAHHLSLSALVPFDGMSRGRELPFAARKLGPMRGIPWEQLILPLRKGKGTLLNLCNIGPVLSGDAVTMIHDVQVLLTPESYRPAFRLWYRIVQPLLARRHLHLLTVSQFSRGQIVAAGLAPPEKVSVVYNGCDHVFRVAPDTTVLDRLGLDQHAYVLALSVTQVHKNIAVLLEAFALPELADQTLVLFGSAMRQDFERLGLFVPRNVVFAGRVDDAALAGLMTQALCLAFPSTTEGFGLPPLEAMALGCPVIAAPCGALPEVCGTAAAFADPHDVSAWATAILEMASNSANRENLIRLGRKQAEKFTWRRAAISLAGVLSSN